MLRWTQAICALLDLESLQGGGCRLQGGEVQAALNMHQPLANPYDQESDI